MSRTGTTTAIGPKAYASWRNQRLGAITEEIEHRLVLDMTGAVAGRRILDAGCGDGSLACRMATEGAEVTGVDPDQAMLIAARSRAADAGVVATFLDGRVERLPFPEASFDTVVSVTVLCFVPDPARALQEMSRVLRPGGRLVLGELGRWSLWAAIRRLRGWLGAPVWRVARFRTAAELRSLVEGAGIRVVSVRGAIFYPPCGPLARVLAAVDPWLGRTTTVGAAFIALAGTKA